MASYSLDRDPRRRPTFENRLLQARRMGVRPDVYSAGFSATKRVRLLPTHAMGLVLLRVRLSLRFALNDGATMSAKGKQDSQRMEELREQLNLHNYRYHVLESPIISDSEYDLMLR